MPYSKITIYKNTNPTTKAITPIKNQTA